MHVTKIYGPPGTGKTTRLLEHLETEIGDYGVKPEKVAFLTFTVQARKIAVERVREKFGYKKDQMPYFKTLHSVAFHQLGMMRQNVLQDNHLRALGKFLAMDFTLDRHDLDGLSLVAAQGGTIGDKLMTIDHLRRHRMVSLEEALTKSRFDIELPLARYFTDGYQKWKAVNFIFDYTDLLQRVWKPLDIDAALVDEGQDLSKLQWKVFDVFALKAKRVYIAGDDDQAIFEWAGANPHEFFVRHADRVEVLHQSYRVPKKVHSFAAVFTEMMGVRYPKDWSPRAEVGEVTMVMNVDAWEPRDTKTARTMVLYRNHAIARRVELHLRTLGEPYSRLDRGRAPGLQWAEAILLWESLRRGHALTDAEWNVVLEATNTAKARVDPTLTWFEALDRISDDDSAYLRRVIQRHGAHGLKDKPLIDLSTIHAAKGDEADHVVLMTDMSKRTSDGLYDEPEAEARVLYVACTRAKKTLTIVGAHHPLLNGHSYV